MTPALNSVNIEAMTTERTSEIGRRAGVHAAQADPARLRIVDTLTIGDVSPSELLAAALWRRSSAVPATSAGTHPGYRIDPGAIDTAKRHHLPLRRVRPQRVQDVLTGGDLVITVCDLAHEDLAGRADLHWSIPDPVRTGNDTTFDRAFDELTRRVSDLAPHLFGIDKESTR